MSQQAKPLPSLHLLGGQGQTGISLKQTEGGEKNKEELTVSSGKRERDEKSGEFERTIKDFSFCFTCLTKQTFF